ncbi:hypothetical protein GKE82_02040 [Conexibacter sp. W3-3-2]|uniref:alpha-amylase family protein n=1 Tax=Conexibacter sp. W3-3-2 TaxID=2675227 RepID=UPI0012B8EC25|nr:alpha-amylase family protein [Conexibacter sp. W3-3-2]MTD43117.1 hypothetical protein [Conexibacter sp. W3-3-2]
MARSRTIARHRRSAAGLAALAALAGALGAGAAPAQAARGPLATIVQDDAQLLHRAPEQVAASLDRLRDLGVDTVRITAGWSVLTRDADTDAIPADFDQTDPAAYEQARFTGLDTAIRLADERGLRVLLDLAFWAPQWAAGREEGEPMPRARRGVDAQAYGRFATALARRYDGTFTPPPAVEPVPPTADGSLLDQLFGTAPPPAASAPSAGPLPRVARFSLWNEPNHPAFLLPQTARSANGSPALYRRMVRAADAAIRAVQPDATVLIGGLASKGTNGRGIAPLRFVRELACVDGKLRPLRTAACRDFRPVPGDGFTIHPYSLSTPPDARPSASQPDDTPLGALPKLIDTLDRLVRAGRLSRGLRDVWITEYGYETNPPARTTTFGLDDQARFLPWAEYLAWRQPRVRAFAQFLLRDLPPAASVQGQSDRRAFGQWESGLLFADGTDKPAAAAFAAGLFVRPADRTGRRLAVWGRLRTGTGLRTVVLEARAPRGTWRRLPGTVRTRSGVVTRTLPAAGIARGSLVRMRVTAADGTVSVSPAFPVLHRPSPLR